MTLPRKDFFDLPNGVLYLDGNSLGPLPKSASARVARVLQDEWGGQLIRAWNSAGWMDMPRRVGDRLAALVGAPAGSVATGDTYLRRTSALSRLALRPHIASVVLLIRPIHRQALAAHLREMHSPRSATHQFFAQPHPMLLVRSQAHQQAESARCQQPRSKADLRGRRAPVHGPN